MEKLGETKEKVIEKFKALKKSNELTKDNLKDLLQQCNTIPEIIEYYLNFLKDIKDKDYLSELLYYYTIISDNVCKEHKINKLNEQTIFYNIIDKIIESEKKDLSDFAEKELKSGLKEIESIIQNDNLDYSRWDHVYNTNIDFYDIYNEELLFYKLSNTLLRDFDEGLSNKNGRKIAIEKTMEIFKDLYKNRKKYPQFFEYVCLGIMNVSVEIEEDSEYLLILGTIITEMENEMPSIEKLQKYFEDHKKKKMINDFTINGTNIKLKIKNFQIDINDFNNYELYENNLLHLYNSNKYTWKSFLNSIRSFYSYINKNNYFGGLLIKSIINYSNSNLSNSSTEKIFNVNKNSHPDLFNEVTNERLLNYIYFIPYNSNIDTSRILKFFSKIVIDPLKDTINIRTFKLIKSTKLNSDLRLFVNIITRKYKFEHEYHHLINNRLFFKYINNKRRINSLPKKIEKNEIIEVTENYYKNNKNKEQNLIKESGNLSEILCYGQVQKKFTLKQLLFIANEENEKLDYQQYKEKYNNFNDKLDVIIENFPKTSIFSKLVEEIRKGFKEEANLDLNKGKTAEEILGEYHITRSEDSNDYLTLDDLENIPVANLDEICRNIVYESKYHIY